jgi:hypothetical protein
MNHIFGWFTDVKNRPEIKAVLGVVCILTSFGVSIPWLIIKGDVGGAMAIFGTFFGAGLSLLGITALADAKNDAIGQDVPVTLNLPESPKVS